MHTHAPLTPEELREIKKEFDYIMEHFLPKYRKYLADGTLMAAIDEDAQFADDGMVLMTLAEKIGISDFGTYLQELL